MKKVIEFLMWTFFGMFFMGVLTMFCGLAEFSIHLLLYGGITAVVGLLLSVVCFTIGERIGNKNR